MVAKKEGGAVYVVKEAPQSPVPRGHRRGRAVVRQYDERGRLRAISTVRGDGFHRTSIHERYLRPDCGLGLLLENYAEPSRSMLLDAEPGGLTPVKPPSGSDWKRALPKHPLDQLIDQFVMVATLGQVWDGHLIKQVVRVR